jgi:predicted nucleic acid-binding protein
MIVFLDSSALLAYFEGAAPRRSAVVRILEGIKAAHPLASVAVSRLGMMQCRFKPLRDGNARLLARYEAFFQQVQVVELTAAVVDQATRLRVTTGLNTPDALQAASALSLPAPAAFITGDEGFTRVRGLDVLLATPDDGLAGSAFEPPPPSAGGAAAS